MTRKIQRRLRVARGMVFQLPTWDERRRIIGLRRTIGQQVEEATREQVFHPRGLGSRPVVVRAGTTDVSSLEDVLFHQHFLPNEPLTNVRVVVDLGGNTGIVSAQLAELFPDARVICVEPDRQNAELARRNTYAWRDRLEVVEAAAWIFDGTVHLSGTSHDGYYVGGGANPRSVRALGMTSLIAAYDLDEIDFLKVDIEGGEGALLTDGSLAWLARVRALKVEVHAEQDLPKIYASLCREGFRCSRDKRHDAALWAVRETSASGANLGGIV